MAEWPGAPVVAVDRSVFGWPAWQVDPPPPPRTLMPGHTHWYLAPPASLPLPPAAAVLPVDPVSGVPVPGCEAALAAREMALARMALEGPGAGGSRARAGGRSGRSSRMHAMRRTCRYRCGTTCRRIRSGAVSPNSGW